MKRINAFLHSEASVLLVLALALLAQTPHTATVFHRLADTSGTSWINGASWIHASFYAIALEFATLLFVVRGNRRLAWTFAIVSVLANAAYYWHADMATVDAFRAALISLALPACIAFYSHDVAGVAQNTPAASIVPIKRASASKAQAQPEPDDMALETMLADVNLDGAPDNDMAQAWQMAYKALGKVGVADDAIAERFGISKRTVTRRRLDGWKAW